MPQKIIYTAGVFDLLHEGHLNILKMSKALGDKLVVGVVSDGGTERYKRQRPHLSQEQRLAYIQALACVDLAIIQEETDPTRELEIIRPHVFTHGDDWPQLLKGQKTLERLGIEFVLLPYTPGISTTEIKKTLWRNG